MQHIKIPMSEIMTLIVNSEVARINEDNTHMMAVIGDTLHILLGDFSGIESAEDLSEIIKRNLS